MYQVKPLPPKGEAPTTGLSVATREVTECYQTARVGDGSQNGPVVLGMPMLHSLSRLPGKCPPKRTGHEVKISE